jgi:hypothetical protein
VDIRLYRRPPGTGLRGLALAVALTAVSMLTACMAAPAHPSSSPTPPSRTSPEPGTSHVPQAPPGGPAWLLTRSALAQLRADPVVRDELRSSRIYEILQPGQRALAGVTAEPVVTFASAAALENAISGGQLAAGTYGVLYDPEAWSFTPVTEQRDPVRAAARAAAVAHAHGLRLIVAPALDLTTGLNPGDRKPRWQQFLALNLAGQLATAADFIELQAQSLERDTAVYASFVRAATSQAMAANPGISVLAGLSTNPPGAPVDSQQLTAAIHATQSAVVGYWLNIPGQGARCPTCNPSRPDIASQVLRQLH